MNSTTVWLPPANSAAVDDVDDATDAIRKRIEKLAADSGRAVVTSTRPTPADDARVFATQQELLERLEDEREAHGPDKAADSEPELNRAARRKRQKKKRKRGKGVTR